MSCHNPPHVMIASTVYGFEDEIEQICGVLRAYGYHVLSSHLGTIPTDPRQSNLENCLAAVDSCDAFLGIIRPHYGSGVVRGKSITHREMLRAIDRGIPSWWLVHEHVTIARQLFRQFRFRENGTKKRRLKLKKNGIMDDMRVLDMYDEVIQDGVPVAERRGNWAQEFSRLQHILIHIEAEFSDVDRIRGICEER